MNAGHAPQHVLRATFALLGIGCANVPALGEVPSARLRQPSTEHGELVYEGDVVPSGRASPAFRYERRSRLAATGDWVSTHLTTSLSAPDRPVVLQVATHTEDYELRAFEEIHAQLGLVSRVEVVDGGSLVFTRLRGEESLTDREGPGAPVVVGPTLFGYVLAHYAELASRRRLRIRFAAADRGRSFAFDLRLENARTVAMVPQSPIFRLFVGAIRMTLDGTHQRITSYRGPVPPRLEGRSFDAQVGYRYARATYR